MFQLTTLLGFIIVDQCATESMNLGKRPRIIQFCSFGNLEDITTLAFLNVQSLLYPLKRSVKNNRRNKLSRTLTEALPQDKSSGFGQNASCVVNLPYLNG